MNDNCYAFFALLQGWTSTAWLIACTKLSQQIGGPVFSAAIAHILAFAIFSIIAIVQNTVEKDGWQQLAAGVREVPYKLAFFSGLGWTSTIILVATKPIVGVLLVQILNTSGELLTAALMDTCIFREKELAVVAVAVCVVLLGVAISVSSELQNSMELSSSKFILSAAATMACGACLVLNSLGSTHMRKYIGATNAAVCTSFVASIGNMVAWLVAEITNYAHFKLETDLYIFGLVSVVGFASAYMVFVFTFVPKHIGFAPTFCAIVAGKMSGGLFIDSTGFSHKQRPVTISRVVGVILVFGGGLLLKLLPTDACQNTCLNECGSSEESDEEESIREDEDGMDTKTQPVI